MKVEIKLEKSRRRKEARRNKGLNSYEKLRIFNKI